MTAKKAVFAPVLLLEIKKEDEMQFYTIDKILELAVTAKNLKSKIKLCSAISVKNFATCSVTAKAGLSA